MRLFLPDVLYLLGEIPLFLLLFITTGILPKIQAVAALTEAEQIVQLNTFFATNFVQIITSLVVFVLVSFFYGTSMGSWKLVLIKNRVLNKTTSIKEAWNESKKFFWRLAYIKVLAFVILFAAAILGFILMALTKGMFVNELASLIILIVVILIAELFIYFRHAALFFKNTSAVGALQESMKFFKANKSLVFGVIITVFIIHFLFVNLSLKYIPGISVVFIMIVSVWSKLFVFNTYKPKQKTVKKRVRKKRK